MTSRGVSSTAAIYLTSFVAAVVQVFLVAVLVPLPARVETRVTQHFFETGHFIALGLVAAGLCGVFRFFGARRARYSFAALFVASCSVGALVLPIDVSNMAARYAGEHGHLATSAVRVGTIALVSFAVPIAWAIGRQLARPYLRWVGILGGTSFFIAHSFILPRDYHGIHFFLTLMGATLFATSFTGTVIQDKLGRVVARVFRPALSKAALLLSALWASVSLVIAPSPRVGRELLRTDGAVVAHVLPGVLREPTPIRKAEIPANMRPWFRDRRDEPSVLPSEPRLLLTPPLVILLTIDCLRADVALSAKHDSALPSLTWLRQNGISFTNARATGSSTVPSMAGIFLGTYYSQQYWTDHLGSIVPHEDDSPRLQELLRRGGISSTTYVGAPGILPEFGVTRGFSEAKFITKGGNRYTEAALLTDTALDRLAQLKNERFFLYLHFLDAHAPYDLGRKSDSRYDRYLSELELVDAQLARLFLYLQRSGLWLRTLLIVTADHGEAFGEHGMTLHAATVYDELLRVPLFVWGPGLAMRKVEEPVSLIDMAPTILDIFGLPTPGRYMGQSLVPFLRGETPKLDRPILAEARLKQTLILPDGRKVIVDNVNYAVELYNLRADPAEEFDLADDPERLSEPLSLLRQFFEVQTLKKPGYKPPFRR